MKLHTGGRLRAWLGRRLGGDPARGDRAWRRILHVAGAAVLLTFVVPPGILVVVSVRLVLVAALAAVLLLELLRLLGIVELPTIRPHEVRRGVASYPLYAIGLVLAVLLFPEPVAVAGVLVAALVDPFMGWVRGRGDGAFVPGTLLGALLAGIALAEIGRWSVAGAFVGGGAIGLLGAGVEGPRWPGLDDDLLMTLVPGAVVTALILAGVPMPSL